MNIPEERKKKKNHFPFENVRHRIGNERPPPLLLEGLVRFSSGFLPGRMMPAAHEEKYLEGLPRNLPLALGT